MTENKILTCKKYPVLEDGLHQGKIIGINWRTNPYEYMDVVIESEDLTVKVGFPANLYPTNITGQLLTKFGANFAIGDNIDPVKILVGKPCAFVSIKKGNFANIQPQSLRPQ